VPIYPSHHQVLASKTKLYLVLELVTGGELFRLLVRERGFSEDRARFFFKQLVEGVKECHDQGICHRDLKPENLLLDSNGDLKITDFGLSALHNNNENATQTSTQMLHTTCGSPNYVAPEILKGEGYDGRKADVWSMGVIAYVLATGTILERWTASRSHSLVVSTISHSFRSHPRQTTI